jgi:hypothetical protein
MDLEIVQTQRELLESEEDSFIQKEFPLEFR